MSEKKKRPAALCSPLCKEEFNQPFDAFSRLLVLPTYQRYTYRMLQTIQMKLIFLCVWAELAILGSAKTALKFKYEIYIG